MAAVAHPTTVRRMIAGERVRGSVGRRIENELGRRGLLPQERTGHVLVES